ncbi:hypothetical protein C5167_048242 [Papaver somniferum]|uniref:Uncharacterized protein n=1 Tax=Papaver somniferum TaxID=3469 RepID=A0A4Y7KK59_PAPSO|nr:hypothetical protein C5167_048242 [Papaver somniferum]
MITLADIVELYGDNAKLNFPCLQRDRNEMGIYGTPRQSSFLPRLLRWNGQHRNRRNKKALHMTRVTRPRWGRGQQKISKRGTAEEFSGANSNQNDETEANVIGERVEEVKVDSTEQTTLYARIIQVLDTGDETSRKSLKDELLKIIEKESSKQNGETKAKVISENGCLRETDLGDRCVKWFKGKHKTSRNSREEPPPKKNKSEEKNGDQNDESMSGCLREFLEKRARLADGEEVHQFDYMSTKPWYPERILKPLGPFVT